MKEWKRNGSDEQCCWKTMIKKTGETKNGKASGEGREAIISYIRKLR